MIGFRLGILLLILGMAPAMMAPSWVARADEPLDWTAKLMGDLRDQGQQLSTHAASLKVSLSALSADVSPPLQTLQEAAVKIINRAKAWLCVPGDAAAAEFAFTMIRVDIGVARSSLTRLNVALVDRPVPAESRTEIEAAQKLLEVMFKSLPGENPALRAH